MALLFTVALYKEEWYSVISYKSSMGVNNAEYQNSDSF